MNNKLDRLYYLDALRSFLILSVVLLHSSQIYNPSKTWNIYSEEESSIVGFLVEFLGLLCMPTFFMVAGFFSVLSLRHADGINFLFKRLNRLVIPFITIIFTLNILQAYILVYFGWKSYTVSTYWTQGYWLSHMWFLLNLITYTIISYILVRYFRVKTRNVLFFISQLLEKRSIYMLLMLLPLINLGLVVAFKYIQIYIMGININQIIVYTPYFVFGIILSLNKPLLDKFSEIPLFFNILIVIVAYMLMKNFEGLDTIAYKVSYYYFKSLGIWSMASLAFGIFKKYFNRESELLYRISDSSYTIYLVHHCLVIIFGLLWIKFNLNFVIGLPSLFIIVAVLSYNFHRKVVLKFKLIQLLVNGKRAKK